MQLLIFFLCVLSTTALSGADNIATQNASASLSHAHEGSALSSSSSASIAAPKPMLSKGRYGKQFRRPQPPIIDRPQTPAPTFRLPLDIAEQTKLAEALNNNPMTSSIKQLKQFYATKPSLTKKQS